LEEARGPPTKLQNPEGEKNPEGGGEGRAYGLTGRRLPGVNRGTQPREKKAGRKKNCGNGGGGGDSTIILRPGNTKWHQGAGRKSSKGKKPGRNCVRSKGLKKRENKPPWAGGTVEYRRSQVPSVPEEKQRKNKTQSLEPPSGGRRARIRKRKR